MATYDYQALGQKMYGSTEISDLVGTRIYHGTVPETESTLPNINYFLVSRPNIAFGYVQRPRFQISCRAETAAEAMNLAQTVREVLINLQESIGGFDIQDIYYDDSRMLLEPENIHHVPVDVFMTYNST